ncbi:MAG: hypothetical protein RLY93_05495 [Sumerlaeia bacterium]
MTNKSDNPLELHSRATSIPSTVESASEPFNLLYLENHVFGPHRIRFGMLPAKEQAGYLDKLARLRLGPRDADGELILPKPPRVPTGYPLKEFLRFMAVDPMDSQEVNEWSEVLPRYARFHNRLMTGGIPEPADRKAMTGPMPSLPGVMRPFGIDAQGNF